MPANKLCLDDVRDVGETLVVWHAVDVFSGLLAELLIGPQLPGLLVFSLQFI